MTISQRLRIVVEKAIHEGSETRYSVAKQAGIDYRALSRWLDEERDIRLSTADKLAEYFGLELK